MTDPSILQTEAFKLVYDKYKEAINQGPTYVCDICWKNEFRKSVVQLVKSKFETEILEKCTTGKSEWICNTCQKNLLKGKIPMQAQANNLSLCNKYPELDCLSGLELMLITQIIPFMYIQSRGCGATHGIKGQTVMVPADLKKIQEKLPRAVNEDCLISLALKRRLSDNKAVKQEYIRPAFVNRALQKLKEINPLYKNVIIERDWEDLTENSDPDLWNFLTNKDDCSGKAENNDNVDCLTDSDEENDDVDIEKTRKDNAEASLFPTVLHETNGPNVSLDEMINIAPGEGQIPVSFKSEPDWEALCFPNLYPTAKNHFNTERDVPITVSKYVHARLKCCDDRFASNPQYIFQCLDWIERTAIASSIHFAERKQYQRDINAGQLRDKVNVNNLIRDDAIFYSFKGVRGTPQYFHQMSLDMLAKYRRFGKPTFFVTGSAAEFQWTEVIKIIGKQYGENLTDDEVNAMDRETKILYLKRNPVTAARQIDYIFQKLWGIVILGGMHPLGQIINYDDRDEFQKRGTEHFHATVHVKDAPIVDEDDDEIVTDFIDKYITCHLPDDDLELRKEVQTKLTHRHTFTCKKKKGVVCRFHAPWPVSARTLIARKTNFVDENTTIQRKRILEKVLIKALELGEDLSNVTEQELLSRCDVTPEQYCKALEECEKEISIVYKREPSDIMIGPYNTVIFSCLRANMNVQYIASVYALLTYLTSYLCKPEHNMSELMRKASKEAYGKDVKGKMQAIGDVLATKREYSVHEAVKLGLSLRLRHSNNDVLFVPTGFRKNIIRILKSPKVLETMHPDDPDIYAPNLLDKYKSRPDSVEDMCYATFAATFKSCNATIDDPEDIANYTSTETSGYNEELNTKVKIINLKNDLGKMKQRDKECVIRWHNITEKKDSEGHYHQKLQLYMPWRKEDDMKSDNQTFKDKFEEVKSEIQENMNHHEPYYNIDVDDLPDPFIEQLEEDEGNNEFSMFDPSLIDFDISDNDRSNSSSSTSNNSVQVVNMPNNTFYDMCAALNEKQLHLFNFIMQFAVKYRYAEKNNVDPPPPFFIFLSGGAGVGKSYLIQVITEFLRRILRYPDQSILDQPSVLVTASTGKAATNVNGTTLHSAFQLQVRRAGRIFQYCKAGSENIHVMRHKYRHLTALIIDEISMIGNETFHHLDLRLQEIMNKKSSFGGTSVLVVGDLLQLPPVKQQGVFTNPPKGKIESFQGSVWQNKFLLHELTEIVRQINDPEFAEMLSRIREDEHTDEDIEEIKKLEFTDKSLWPDGVVQAVLTNERAREINENAITNLNSEITTIIADDTRKDVQTGICPISIDKTRSLSDTGNLPGELKVCKGARFMLTINVDVSDRLINGSIGTIKHVYFNPRNNLEGTIYVQFDDPKAGSMRKVKCRDERKEWVQINAMTKSFPYTRGKTTVTVQRRQYPGVIAHAITIHKSQGSTLEYMIGNLNRTTSKSSKHKVPIGQGQVYTLLSRAKSRNKIQLLNFEPEHIRVNKDALEEMNRMRKESVFDWQHPLKKTDKNICLFNIRSWNAHIKHFLSDKLYTDRSSIICFTETHLNNNNFTHLEELEDNWKDIHKPTEHGLAICYNTNKVKFINQLEGFDQIEILPVLFEIDQEQILIILVYRTAQLEISSQIYYWNYATYQQLTERFYLVILI